MRAQAMTVRDEGLSLAELYGLYNETIGIVEETKWVLQGDVRDACDKCLEVLRDFGREIPDLDSPDFLARIEALTGSVKREFKAMTELVGVVDLDDEINAIFSMAETAHAAAHMGHLLLSMDHGAEGNRIYDSLQRGYIAFGLMGAQRFASEVYALQAVGGA